MSNILIVIGNVIEFLLKLTLLAAFTGALLWLLIWIITTAGVSLFSLSFAIPGWEQYLLLVVVMVPVSFLALAGL